MIQALLFLATITLSLTSLNTLQANLDLRDITLKAEVIRDRLEVREELFRLGSLAPAPGSIVEGTSTAGWTDDGSIVRLNTAADNVGIGTANPTTKLQVNGAILATGNLTVSGGTFAFGGASGTSTLTVANSGRLGVGSTTPARTLSVHGDAIFSGTTTVSGFYLASSTITAGSQVLRFVSGSTASGTALTTDGAGGLSWNTVATLPSTAGVASTSFLVLDGSGTQAWTRIDWQKIAEVTTAAASSSITINAIPARKELKLTIDTTGLNSAKAYALRFNFDGSSNYGFWTSLNNLASTNQGGSQTEIQFNNAATTSPAYIVANINNELGRAKFVSAVTSTNVSGASQPMRLETSAVWNNTSAQITSIDFLTTDASTFNAGTRVTVYGRRDN